MAKQNDKTMCCREYIVYEKKDVQLAQKHGYRT